VGNSGVISYENVLRTDPDRISNKFAAYKPTENETQKQLGNVRRTTFNPGFGTERMIYRVKLFMVIMMMMMMNHS
jgi:hypothetical protein